MKRLVVLLPFLIALTGCGSLVKVNIPTEPAANEYVTVQKLLQELNSGQVDEFYHHLAINDARILESSLKSFIVFDLFSKYIDACLEGAYFVAFEESAFEHEALDPFRLHLVCINEDKVQPFILALQKKEQGYVVSDIENLLAPYSFREVVDLFASMSDPGDSRGKKFGPLTTIKDRQSLARFLENGHSVTRYSDMSFVVAQAMKFESVDLLHNTQLEVDWLDQLENKWSKPVLVGSYLMVKEDWSLAADAFDLALRRYEEDWIIHALYAETLMNLQDDRALYHATRAFVISPERPETVMQLAEIFIQLGKKEEAKNPLLVMQEMYGDLSDMPFTDFPKLQALVGEMVVN
ncbi:MAG: hypothetical protein MI864_15665 [Pseudomonadales bacterium]|nr:hypothetical protein [Pseudomonadales bacterium]